MFTADNLERAYRDRLERLTGAHTILADAAAGPSKSLHRAVAAAFARLLDSHAAFFLAQRGAIIEFGKDETGETIERSTPSALDLVPWATGAADGSAPFGYIESHWATIWLRVGEEIVGGVIVYGLDAPPDESQRAEFLAIAAHAGAALRMRAAVETAERMATTDALTGAKTRQAFMDALDGASGSRIAYVVVYLDFDGFKQINDEQGHAAGDEILKRGARVLMQAVRSDEMVARLGGDEFTVLVRAEASETQGIAARLTTALAEAGIAASVGAVPVAEDAATSLALADASMYETKRRRKSRLRSI
jgi:diguanylate cyclase (GGDEF)-like protein